MANKEHIVMYHGNCDDGFGAAFVLWQKFGELADYVACKYGDTPDPAHYEGASIYIVDFSFPLPLMQELQHVSNSLVVLDHHKTAREALAGMIPREQDIIVFDMERSGAMLAWNFVNPDKQDDKAAMFIQYLQDRDLYTKKLPGCDLVTRRVRSFPQDFEVWTKNLFTQHPDDLAMQGEAIEEFFQNQLQFLLLNKHRCNIAGIDGMAVCGTPLFGSEAGHELAVESGTFGCVYYISNKGIVVSLRSNGNECDVSAVAKKFGGGGHKNAAGFTIPHSELTPLVHGRVG